LSTSKAARSGSRDSRESRKGEQGKKGEKTESKGEQSGASLNRSLVRTHQRFWVFEL